MTTPTMITQDLHVEVKIGRRIHYEAVAGFAEASRWADRVRLLQIREGLQWRDVWIVAFNAAGARKRVARISQNGRVWAPRPWRSGDVPLYDPPMEA